ncbi:hypothetical protein ACFPA8_20080 [Streptomyces ovatisporus]|uniref:Uncharacterized protein n=1 Tax=Streptomyces ovatisporus TaxID=1128682 RepID=A0ABV9A9U3_9ACTN
MTTTESTAPTAAPTARALHARPLRTELRRGSWAVLAVAVMIYGTLVQLLALRLHLAHSWVWSHDALRAQAVLIGGSWALFVGCLRGGRDHRRGTAELFASMPAAGRLRQVAVAAAPAVLWPVVAYVVTAAVCLVVTSVVHDVPSGLPFPTLLVADAVAVGSLGVVGFTAGRRLRPLRRLPAAPLLGVGAGILMSTLHDGNLPGLVLHQDALHALSPAAEHMAAWEVPASWFGPLSALFTGGLAVAALLACSALRRAAVVALVLALACGGVLAGTAGTHWRTDRDAVALVCDEGTPQVCAVRAHRPYLSEMSRALTGLKSKLRRIPNAPSRLVEVPFREAGAPVPALAEGDAVLDQPTLDFRERPGSWAGRAPRGVSLYGCAEPEIDAATVGRSSPVPAKYSEAVATWLSPSPERETGYGGAAYQKLRTMPERERTAWLGAYFAAVRDCRPERIRAL